MDKSFIEETAESAVTATTLSKIRTILKIFVYSVKLRGLIKKYEINIVHTNTLKSGLITIITKLYCKFKHIYHDRTDTRSKINNLIYSNSDKIIAISKYVGGKYNEKEKVKVVYNGVALRKEKDIKLYSKYGQFKIGIIGRLAPWKGQDTFIKAATSFLNTNNGNYEVEFYVVGGSGIEGSSAYEEYLYKLSRETIHHHKIKFTGYLSDMDKVYDELDIIIAPSKNPEPFGRVIIEAQMAGKPIISTAMGGVLELINHEETGLLIESDDHESLEKYIKKLIVDQEFYNNISTQGYKSVQKFNIKHHVDEVLKIYDNI
ncbi:glycosyltransferase family 4 protein [Alkalicoccobacillus plakortidis]|uniref:Glycosyltransferase family 4 protein n=1 Tax=Alkalicoccobacillus plakortidis TaxID=444060 RepID=A0ABT0XJH4_9BACI|nr:glycosyltransferase family 4 protein [Alkalicoccobacillus plakortidis]MCM2675915.1 glycosyltransferase family 4 protein [Alkalicoccobacillus plakortidis]